jgi:glycosyltransferase involved in cell wall biosynthesis
MGSLNAPRGVEMLLKAFSLVEGNNFELIIAGRGELEKNVRAATTMDSRIRYLGFLSKNEILDAYNQASVIVNPHLCRDRNSRYIFPSKLFEGMVSGRPVISTNVGNVLESYGDLLYGAVDDRPESFAKAIVDFSLASIKERREKALQARNFVVHHKLWEQQSKDCLNFINTISAKTV